MWRGLGVPAFERMVGRPQEEIDGFGLCYLPVVEFEGLDPLQQDAPPIFPIV